MTEKAKGKPAAEPAAQNTTVRNLTAERMAGLVEQREKAKRITPAEAEQLRKVIKGLEG